MFFVARFWDVRTMKEFKTLETGHSVSSMEISRDGSILVVTYGNEVSFWNTNRYILYVICSGHFYCFV